MYDLVFYLKSCWLLFQFVHIDINLKKNPEIKFSYCSRPESTLNSYNERRVWTFCWYFFNSNGFFLHSCEYKLFQVSYRNHSTSYSTHILPFLFDGTMYFLIIQLCCTYNARFLFSGSIPLHLIYVVIVLLQMLPTLLLTFEILPTLLLTFVILPTPH